MALPVLWMAGSSSEATRVGSKVGDLEARGWRSGNRGPEPVRDLSSRFKKNRVDQAHSSSGGHRWIGSVLVHRTWQPRGRRGLVSLFSVLIYLGRTTCFHFSVFFLVWLWGVWCWFIVFLWAWLCGLWLCWWVERGGGVGGGNHDFFLFSFFFVFLFPPPPLRHLPTHGVMVLLSQLLKPFLCCLCLVFCPPALLLVGFWGLWWGGVVVLNPRHHLHPKGERGASDGRGGGGECKCASEVRSWNPCQLKFPGVVGFVTREPLPT